MINVGTVGSIKPGGRGLEDLHEVSVYLIGIGIALMLVGLVAIGSSLVATLTSMLVFGILLIVGGIFQGVTALWGRSWNGFSLHLLTSILYLVAGVFMIDNPLEAASALTLLIAACLVVGGLLRTIMSAVERFEGWVWVLLNGVVSLVLGVGIWRQWPFSGQWVIGLYIGIEMLVSGMSWVLLGRTMRSRSVLSFKT
jgi:uncharacterized membrane protein HdeD (DUF308 family)